MAKYSKKRKGSKKSKKSSKKSKKVVKDKTRGDAVLNINNKKAVSVNQKKEVKVSKVLRAKIKKVVDEKEIYTGTIVEKFIGGRMGAVSRVQAVYPGAFEGPQGPKYSWLFTLGSIMDYASQLWNQKQPGQGEFEKYSPSGLGNFDPRYTIIEVKNMTSTYTFHNGTLHPVHLTLYIGVPKKKGSIREWESNLKLGSRIDASVAVVEDAMLDLYHAWVEGLETDTNQGLALQGWTPPVGLIDQPAGLRNPNVADIGRSPLNCQALKNLYKIEEVKLFMLPGQTVYHKIQGPQNITIDFSKTLANDVIQNVRTFSRTVMATVVNAPNSLGNYVGQGGGGNFVAAATGRFADQVDTTAAGFCIQMERSDYACLKMPDQVGFTYQVDQAPGAKQFLNQRRPRHRYNVFDAPALPVPEGQTRAVIDIAVMNPQQPVNQSAGGS